jgi:hypothetical protein
VADPDYEAEFREGIASTIPSIIKALDDKEWTIRRDTVQLFSKLANHGE